MKLTGLEGYVFFFVLVLVYCALLSLGKQESMLLIKWTNKIQKTAINWKNLSILFTCWQLFIILSRNRRRFPIFTDPICYLFANGWYRNFIYSFWNWWRSCHEFSKTILYTFRTVCITNMKFRSSRNFQKVVEYKIRGTPFKMK